MRRFDEAIACLQDAIRIHRDTGARYSEGAALCNYGAALIMIDRPEDAIIALQDAARIFREIEDQRARAQALGSDPAEALNSAVGSALVRTLPVPGAGSDVNRGVVGVLHAEWLEAYSHITDLELYKRIPLNRQEIDSIRSSFEVVMGRPVPEPLFDMLHIAQTYGSAVGSDDFLEWRILDAGEHISSETAVTDVLYRNLMSSTPTSTSSLPLPGGVSR